MCTYLAYWSDEEDDCRDDGEESLALYYQLDIEPWLWFLPLPLRHLPLLRPRAGNDDGDGGGGGGNEPEFRKENETGAWVAFVLVSFEKVSLTMVDRRRKTGLRNNYYFYGDDP